uniref:Eukaryotic translation initiation factor 3 subunit K n=1 Tax=Chlamydomonas leiostraca TaxID=1034604 RepID=A0A7S0X0D0_9CHLO|mmetsp:Transcript_6800/g.16956  ORF Transcript_6800/g.16956 Transcript_6800/m.16956 type:complete len:215 (+) Transcript_6800:54-698(+)|eukprot:CAMPEP_0202865846 /NCGR_PEP_ID=MMETSP1391-20130828/6540_1 /ASSEMBLY_ACC=CAM_ASM_000867 /TAXON_ID=1034604 /ORGANISM="Chlamydomonas leiostraca, Strain SAG 11-49" /LENGTH=214 /DNA_ID=CAMNT_0049545727 /DNA_START=50 /DNA_END=694 /DNA_ORIENTATION=+
MQLTGADKYDAKLVPDLERYVDEQVSKNTWNLDANLALLRHYQFAPSTAKINVLAKLLLKALAQLPDSEFKICIHLVPERLQADESISKVVALAGALETTRFAEFWTLAGSSKDVIALVPGFADAARTYITHILGITYQRVTKAVLGSALQLQGGELDAFIQGKVKSSGWAVSGDIVTLPKNESNSPPVVVKRTQDPIRFEQVAPVLRGVTIGF